MSLLDVLYGLPLIGALITALLGKRRRKAGTSATMYIFLVTAVLTPIMLLLAPPGALPPGISLLAVSAAAIADLILGVHVLQASRRDSARPPGFYALLLVLTGAVNAIAVAQTALFIFGGWALIVFAVVRLLWYGDVVSHVAADREERLKRDREDFYNL